MKKALVIFLFALIFHVMIISSESLSREVPFTQEDRDRLIRLEVKVEEINKRFEQIDKRFEQMDKRFDDLRTFLWIITGIFTTIMVANIGFAYWDRRTIIKKAKEETIAEIERRGKINELISALKEYAGYNEELAKVLRKHNLL